MISHNKLLICLFSLLIGSKTFSNTKLKLSDTCSGQSSSVLTPYGINIHLEITNYDSSLPMTIKADFFPYNTLGEHINKSPISFVTNYKGRSKNQSRRNRGLVLPQDYLKLRIKAPKTKKMIKHERKFKGSNLWVVRVSWFQRGSQNTGVAQKSFLRLQKTEPFYEVLSAGICNWETRNAISSKLYKNNTTSTMNISRDYSNVLQANATGGFSLGPNNNAGNNPLTGSGNSAWYFKDWSQIFEAQSSTMLQRRWSLNRDESGVFGNRWSFTRKKVKRWVWDWHDNLSCKHYKVESDGLLDIGIVTEDFYILPEFIYATDRMDSFIENYRQSLNTCKSSIYNNPTKVDYVTINKDLSILYYYKNSELE